jgi:hypothetical protein
MKFKPNTLANAHEWMRQIKAQSTGGFFTNYFRQEMVGTQILTVATDRSLLMINDEHDFFRLYFFTNDLRGFEEILRTNDYPGDVVAGYLTRTEDKNIAEAFQRSGFNPIANYRRMVSFQLPKQRPNSALEYASSADLNQLHKDLFRVFNKYTDHLPTKSRLLGYIENRQVIVIRHEQQIRGAVCFQLRGRRVNYNYIYSLSDNHLDFLRLQNNFYGVMHERGIGAGFLWVNRSNERLASLYRSSGWRFDGLEDFFYFRSSRN